MPEWQERITRETEPALRVEHEVRYRMAGEAVAQAATWCDLGCGNGLAAAEAIGGLLPASVLLVDVDEGVVDAAREALSTGTPLVADLAAPADLARVRAAVLEADAERVVTCFEVIEHLENFAPLVELLVELARDGAATVLLSVPNDEFWAIENPHHHTTWGEGAFEELRRLLPRDAIIAQQVSLQGSAVVREGGAPQDVAVAVPAERLVATHFLACFGPRAGGLAEAAGVTAVDLLEQRRWVRERESTLAFAEARLRELDELRALAREHTAELDAWRGYIHDLEDRLGLPRSGVGDGAPRALQSG